MALEKYNKAMYIAINKRAFAQAAILLIEEIKVIVIILENTLIKDSRA
jgi:hypothetical protein